MHGHYEADLTSTTARILEYVRQNNLGVYAEGVEMTSAYAAAHHPRTFELRQNSTVLGELFVPGDNQRVEPLWRFIRCEPPELTQVVNDTVFGLQQKCNARIDVYSSIVLSSQT